jgi:hypothetical protein
VGLSTRELRELRVLAQDVRIADPRLARAMLRGSAPAAARWAVGAAAVLASVGLLVVGTPAACFFALALSVSAMVLLRPLLRE